MTSVPLLPDVHIVAFLINVGFASGEKRSDRERTRKFAGGPAGVLMYLHCLRMFARLVNSAPEGWLPSQVRIERQSTETAAVRVYNRSQRDCRATPGVQPPMYNSDPWSPILLVEAVVGVGSELHAPESNHSPEDPCGRTSLLKPASGTDFAEWQYY